MIAAFTFALVRQWRTFDPLVTATMIGVGLLLIVIYERLGHMHSELRTIAYYVERLAGEASESTEQRAVTPATSQTRDAK